MTCGKYVMLPMDLQQHGLQVSNKHPCLHVHPHPWLLAAAAQPPAGVPGHIRQPPAQQQPALAAGRHASVHLLQPRIVSSIDLCTTPLLVTAGLQEAEMHETAPPPPPPPPPLPLAHPIQPPQPHRQLQAAPAALRLIPPQRPLNRLSLRLSRDGVAAEHAAQGPG
jgi:hypothetical protein